ncbi:MAG TPA: hypothetical protein PLA68_18235, partial [Panacibacter sp.]|nr:hypothetical protein [Panacibacter sp.]
MKAFILCILLLLATVLQLQAQTVEERLSQKKPTCREVMTNAASVLPELYAQHSLDSLEKAIGFIDASCPDITELFCLKTLLNIERPSILMPQSVDSNFIDKLNSYAASVQLLKNHNAQVYNSDEYKLISFIQEWATDLLKKRKLASGEIFFCNVLAGNIKNPERELLDNKEKYPELYALLKQGYTDARNSGGFTSAFIAGAWMPTSDLKVLGTHPSLGISFGGRTRNDELDFTLQFKFLKTPNSYEILRQNTLYSRNNFFGGYIGLDYTKYFIHTTAYELGWLGGLGFDGFDVASSSEYDNSNDYLKPLSINSFNF